MKRLIAAALLISFASVSILAVDGKKAMYVGGTRTDIKEAAEGRLDVSSETEMAFTPDKTKVRHTLVYSGVTELEYGQKAGRRVAVALLVSPFALFSKKRKHYLTVSYTTLPARTRRSCSSWARISCEPPWRSSRRARARRFSTRTTKRENLERAEISRASRRTPGRCSLTAVHPFVRACTSQPWVLDMCYRRRKWREVKAKHRLPLGSSRESAASS